MELADLDLNKTYSYADYYTWTFKDRLELIDGKIFRKEPQVPNTIHQLYCGHITFMLYSHFEHHDHCVFSGIFDVRLPGRSIRDADVFTVVQPDICVILDKNKLDDRGGIGTPDIVVEILSPGNNTVDLNDKFYAYQKAGVKEYWVVFTNEKAIVVYKATNGQFNASRPLVSGNTVTTGILPGFSLDLSELFKTSEFLEKRQLSHNN